MTNESSIWLHRYAAFASVCTFLLVIAGGLVTSTDSGLSVPDWPLSYGMLMPPMVGGIFYEHGHRMIASFVGLLTIGLAVWLWRAETRRWLRRLGWGALAAVVAQGVLGGLTVLYLLPAPVSILHACLAQSFFTLMLCLAIFTSPSWKRNCEPVEDAGGISHRAFALMLAAAVFAQLVLGASVRHMDAGLAIPDFPLAFGRVFPPLESAPVALHFAHRLWALVVTVLTVLQALRMRSLSSRAGILWKLSLAAVFLVAVQAALGAFSVWTALSAPVATAHVAGGALLLALSVVTAFWCFRLTVPRRERAAASRLQEAAA